MDAGYRDASRRGRRAEGRWRPGSGRASLEGAFITQRELIHGLAHMVAKNVRVTTRDATVYAIVLCEPQQRPGSPAPGALAVTIEALGGKLPPGGTRVERLGAGPVSWRREEADVRVVLPSALESLAFALAFTPPGAAPQAGQDA
jgi:hypothetical protein